VQAERKQWADSEKYFNDAAAKRRKSYLAPAAWFNAGIAAEEQNNSEGALGYYKQVVDYTGIFAGAPRAQFSIGRLQEATDKDAAIAAYEEVREKYAADTVWANLAESRLIVLRNGN
jgi:TolA-binding protein